MPKKYTFDAVIQASGGGGAFVCFPNNANAEFGKARVPITCHIDGEFYQGSLVKYGSPNWMLLVRKDIRIKIGKQIGQSVHVVLQEDVSERKVTVPDDFAKLLAKNKMTASFSKLSYTHQREYVQWIESAKRTETRANRLVQVIEKLKLKTL
ncbi:MAG: YdeI/OmpD-associated family protein [Chitinophagales bacterium]